MILIQLFWSFVKIGFTSFGGLSMIPVISSEMGAHHWMTASEIADIVAIAEMTPGPLGINSSTFAGIRAASLPGALAACIGVMTPTLTLTLVAAVFFVHFRESRILKNIMIGVRPASIGLIAGVAVSLSLTNYFPETAIMALESYVPDWPAICLGFIDLFLFFKFKMSIPKVLAISAVIGVLFGAIGI